MGAARLAFVMLCGILIATAAADTKALSDREKRDTAKRYVDAGLAAENAKDFASAVEFYLRAYDLVPHPLLIYNMAEAYRQVGDTEKALAHYKRYLAADPTGPRAKDSAEKIIPLEEAEKVRLADVARKAEEARKVEEARKAEEARLVAEAKQAEETRKAEQVKREAAERELARSSGRRRGDRLKLAGLGVGAAGIAGLAIGVYFGQRANQLSDSVSTTYDARLFSEGEKAERAQIVSLSIGGGLAVAGSVLLYLGWRKSHAPLAVAPTAQGEGAVVSWTGGW